MFPAIISEQSRALRTKIFHKTALLVLAAKITRSLVFLGIPTTSIKILYDNGCLGAALILEWMGVAMVFIGLLDLWINYKLGKMQ